MNRLAGEKKDDEEKHLKTNLEKTNQKDDKSANDNSIKKSNSNEDNHENDEQKAIKPNLNKQNYSILDSLSSSPSHQNSNNLNKNQQLLQPQPQKQIQHRRPSIFDYVNLNEKIANMENEFKDGVDENKSNSSATPETNRSSHLPLLHISYATLDKEAELNDNQMESIQDEDENENGMYKKNKSAHEKRVEFSVAASKQKSSLKTRPKSALKRFNIDTNSLMSQNVDENEEYELLEKEYKPTSSFIANFDQSEFGETNFNSSLFQDNFSSNGCKKSNDETGSNQVSSIKNFSGTNNEKQMQSNQSSNSSSDKSTKNAEKLNVKAKKFKFQKAINAKPSKIDNINQKHDVFVELEELQLIKTDDEPVYEWREVSRWIKYEQNIDLETNIWSKPFVGALVYQSLLYLKTGLQYGTVILNSDHESIVDVIDEMIQDFVDSGHMNKENKDQVKKTILSHHRHNQAFSGALSRKKSTMSEFFPGSRRQSTFNSEHACNSEYTSTSTSRKNSSVQYSDLNLNKNKGENKLSQSEFDLEAKRKNSTQSYNQNHRSSVKFFVNRASLSAQNTAPSDEHHASIDNNLNVSTNHKRRRSTIALIKNTLTKTNLNKSEISIKGISSDTEAFVAMVGVVDYLDRPVMGFVRLMNSQIIGNDVKLNQNVQLLSKKESSVQNEDFVEIQLKVRFLFILLGPKNDNIDYLEIGRCMGTLMTNKGFHECAYRANDRRELIEGITNFTNKSLSLVLPIGGFDDDLLVPIVDWIQNKIKRKIGKFNSDSKLYDKTSLVSGKSKKANSIQNNLISATTNNNNYDNDENDKLKALNDSLTDEDNVYEDDFNPFQKTGYLFGSFLKEVKYRYSKYASDFKDALNIHCLVALIFTFTVCIAPALSFGGILAEKTNKWFGVNEMLIATSLNGIISGLFSGQPLMIMGPTGPFLVFEEMLYLFCKHYFCIEFLAVRCWVAMWVLIFTLIMLAFEGVYVIKYVTRFTEEIFAFLIASVFLTDALKKVIKIFIVDPIYTTDMYCNHKNYTMFTNKISNYTYKESTKCLLYINDTDINDPSSKHIPSPNKALLSLILLVGTCVMALTLKKLRRSVFFGAYVRRTLSDVGMLISIILMVSVDYLIESNTGLKTQKLDIPNKSWVPTKERSWFVSPFGSNLHNFSYWIPFLSIFPALLVFIVLFFEVELTGMILYAKHRKLKKGTGFSLDLLISALMMNFNSAFGLPWCCAAPVRTLAHWASLTVYSKTYVPGEKPKLIDVKEQRLTNICVHVAIGLCLFARAALEMIPISVLFGIFLYFGIVSLSGTQLYERIKLLFIPSKYCPNVVYARGVRPSKRNLFTIIQICFILILLSIKSFNQVSYVFPIILVFLVPLRLFILPKIFTHKELEQLDHDNEMIVDNNATLDFYEITHLPI